MSSGTAVFISSLLGLLLLLGVFAVSKGLGPQERLAKITLDSSAGIAWAFILVMSFVMFLVLGTYTMFTENIARDVTLVFQILKFGFLLVLLSATRTDPSFRFWEVLFYFLLLFSIVATVKNTYLLLIGG